MFTNEICPNKSNADHRKQTCDSLSVSQVCVFYIEARRFHGAECRFNLPSLFVGCDSIFRPVKTNQNLKFGYLIGVLDSTSGEIDILPLKWRFLNLSFVSFYLFHCFHGAFFHAFATLDTKGVIYYRISFGILWNSSDRTCLNQRTNMVMRTYFFIDLYHNYVFVCKVMGNSLFYKIDFLYICDSLGDFIWLSTNYIQLAWERATDKKMPDCSESLYSSCFQITLYLDAKIAFFLRIPEFSGHNLVINPWNNPYRIEQPYRSRVPLTHRQR